MQSLLVVREGNASVNEEAKAKHGAITDFSQIKIKK
jgi:hypothetical protein